MDETLAGESAASDGEAARTSAAWRRRTFLQIAATAAAILAIALAIVLLRGHQLPSGPPTRRIGALDDRTPAVNQPAPDFALLDLQGHIVRLADLRGQVVIVNFWATWCIPCRQELPAIQQVYRDQHDRGLTVLEVNEQESPADVAAFAAQVGPMPPVLLDKSGAVMAQYRLKGLPDTFVVDRQGVVRALSYGPLTRQNILNYVDGARSAAP